MHELPYINTKINSVCHNIINNSCGWHPDKLHNAYLAHKILYDYVYKLSCKNIINIQPLSAQTDILYTTKFDKYGNTTISDKTINCETKFSKHNLFFPIENEISSLINNMPPIKLNFEQLPSYMANNNFKYVAVGASCVFPNRYKDIDIINNLTSVIKRDYIIEEIRAIKNSELLLLKDPNIGIHVGIYRCNVIEHISKMTLYVTDTACPTDSYSIKSYVHKPKQLSEFYKRVILK